MSNFVEMKIAFSISLFCVCCIFQSPWHNGHWRLHLHVLTCFSDNVRLEAGYIQIFTKVSVNI